MFVTAIDLLYRYYVGHFPLSEIHMMDMTFRELALRPSSGQWLNLYWNINFLFYFEFDDDRLDKN
jgi:hypothetical protein